MRTCATREESRGQRVSGWSRARDRRRVGHVRPLFRPRVRKRSAPHRKTHVGRGRSGRPKRTGFMYLAKDASATASSLCADLPMALAWGRSRVRPNSARLASAPRGRAFSIELCLDKPFLWECRSYLPYVERETSGFQEFVDIQLERRGREKRRVPDPPARDFFRHVSRQKNRASAVCLGFEHETRPRSDLEAREMESPRRRRGGAEQPTCWSSVVRFPPPVFAAHPRRGRARLGTTRPAVKTRSRERATTDASP